MPDNYDTFQLAFGEYFANEAEKEIEENNRRDYCYSCQDEGYWVMMALRCRKCEKILMG